MADTTLSFVNAPDIVIDEAYVSRSGSAPSIDITAAAAGAVNAALVPLGFRLDLSDTSTGSVVRLVPLFAGTLEDVALVLDGETTTVGACSAAITIAGVAVVLAAPLSFVVGSVAGAKVVTTVASGGTFTAGQTIEITTTSANTAKTLGGVTLGASRA